MAYPGSDSNGHRLPGLPTCLRRNQTIPIRSIEVLSEQQPARPAPAAAFTKIRAVPAIFVALHPAKLTKSRSPDLPEALLPNISGRQQIFEQPARGNRAARIDITVQVPAFTAESLKDALAPTIRYRLRNGYLYLWIVDCQCLLPRVVRLPGVEQHVRLGGRPAHRQ